MQIAEETRGIQRESITRHTFDFAERAGIKHRLAIVIPMSSFIQPLNSRFIGQYCLSQTEII